MDLVKSDVVDLRMVVLFGPRVPSLLFGEGVLHTDTTWPFWSAKPGIFGTSVLPQLLHLEVSTPHAPDRMHHPMEGVVHVFLLRAAAPNAHIIINMRLDVQPYDVSLEKDFATLLPNVNKPADDVGSLHVAALEVVVTDMDAVVPALRLLSPRVTVEELILTCEQDIVMDAAQRELYTRIEAMQLESIMVGYAENMDFDVRAIMALPSRSSAKDVTIPACSTFGNDILAAVRRLNNYPSLEEVVLDCQCSIVDFDPRALAAIPHAVKHIHVMNVMFEIGFISFMCNLLVGGVITFPRGVYPLYRSFPPGIAAMAPPGRPAPACQAASRNSRWLIFGSLSRVLGEGYYFPLVSGPSSKRQMAMS